MENNTSKGWLRTQIWSLEGSGRTIQSANRKNDPKSLLIKNFLSNKTIFQNEGRIKIFPGKQNRPPYQFNSVQFSRSVVFNSLQPHESQHARPPCPSPTPGVYPNLCPSIRNPKGCFRLKGNGDSRYDSTHLNRKEWRALKILYMWVNIKECLLLPPNFFKSKDYVKQQL